MRGTFVTDGEWESLGEYSSRLKVPGGWIVRTFKDRGANAGGCVHQIFIKDETHKWIIE